MDEFWGLTSTGWTAIAALGAGATTVIAGVAAWLALGQLRTATRQLQASRDAQVEAERPYVVVDVEPSPAAIQLLDLVIRNIGKSAAFTTRVTITPELKRAQEQPGFELAKAKALTDPIHLLPPGREIRMLLDNLAKRKDSELPDQYTAAVQYSSSSGESWSESYTLDLAVTRGAMSVDIKGIHHVAKELIEIRQYLQRASVLGRDGRIEISSAEDRKTDSTTITVQELHTVLAARAAAADEGAPADSEDTTPPGPPDGETGTPS